MKEEIQVTLHDRWFRLLIPYSEIKEAVGRTAGEINAAYCGRERPLFIGVLNGSFMFMAELMKNIDFECEVSFIKIASYQGFSSAGEVSQVVGLSEDIAGRDVIIVEDIVDTGISIDFLIKNLSALKPASIAVATLLLKPKIYKMDHKIDFASLEVPDKFLIGFGLDYNKLGRNLKAIYEVIDE